MSTMDITCKNILQGRKMQGEITSCCVVLLLALTSVFGAQRKINSISDVQLPKDIILLLHWFANEVSIDNSDAIQLNFNCGEYGSHHYGNYERMLERPRWGYKYYTVGNHRDASFPAYVVHRRAGQNTARIVFSIDEEDERRVDRVFITRHLQGTREYDPEHTYEVTTSLLRDIGSLSIEEIQQIANNPHTRCMRNTSDDSLQEFLYTNQNINKPQPATRTTDQTNSKHKGIAQQDSHFQGFDQYSQHSIVPQSTASTTNQSNYECNVTDDECLFRCLNTSGSRLQGSDQHSQHSVMPHSAERDTDQNDTENNLIIFMLVIFVTVIAISTVLFHLIN